MVEPIQLFIYQLFSSCCCYSVSENYRFWLLSLKVCRIIGQNEWQDVLRAQLFKSEFSSPVVFLKSDWFWNDILTFFDELVIFPFGQTFELDLITHFSSSFNDGNFGQFCNEFPSCEDFTFDITHGSLKAFHSNSFVNCATIHLINFIAYNYTHNWSKHRWNSECMIPCGLWIWNRFHQIKTDRTMCLNVNITSVNVQIHSVGSGKQVKHRRIGRVSWRNDDSANQGQRTKCTIVWIHHEVK